MVNQVWLVSSAHRSRTQRSKDCQATDKDFTMTHFTTFCFGLCLQARRVLFRSIGIQQRPQLLHHCTFAPQRLFSRKNRIVHNHTALTLHHQQGFSLLELLIVCNLLGLMLAIGWPSLQEILARHQAKSYMQQFQQHLNFARIMAISSGRMVTFCPKHGNDCLNQWWQIPVQINQQLTNKQLKLLRQLEQPNEMHWLYYNREQIQFRQDGSLQALQNGTFVYCAKQYSWHFTLTLSQAGRSQTEFVPAPCPH
jgi:type IV fimbrial biogenesis protein FimT